MSEQDDAWDPLADPDGRSALKSDGGSAPAQEDPKLKNLRPDELRVLEAARAGKPLRQVEIDSLVRLGLARRRPDGDLELL